MSSTWVKSQWKFITLPGQLSATINSLGALDCIGGLKGANPLDDLVKIEGIGPRVAKVLKAAGIVTFAQLAESEADDIQKILTADGLRMMNAEGWIEQAKLAAAGDWDAFEALKKKLVGGRAAKPVATSSPKGKKSTAKPAKKS